MEKIKFYYNGLKIEGNKKLFKYWISNGARTDGKKGLTVYARTYDDFPEEVRKEFKVENNSDMMTDHFEKDKFFVEINHRLYNDVRVAHDKALRKNALRVKMLGLILMIFAIFPALCSAGNEILDTRTIEIGLSAYLFSQYEYGFGLDVSKIIGNGDFTLGFGVNVMRKIYDVNEGKFINVSKLDYEWKIAPVIRLTFKF